MVVILEGIDGAGKSTALEQLKELFGDSAYYIKEVNPGPKLSTRMEKLNLLQERVGSKSLYIYDRSTCIDDLVYEPIMAGMPSVFEINTKLLDKVISCLQKCLILHFDIDEKTAAKRINQRGDDYVTSDKLDSIKFKYQEVYKTLKQRPKVIKVDDLDPVEIARKCYDSVLDWLFIYQAKTFKLAHIVPLSYLHLTNNDMYHMCLAHLVLEDSDYAKFFKLCRNRGQYVLMDNGAAENSQLNLDQLLECYNKVNPNELVLLDELSDSKKTFEKTLQSLEYFKSKGVKCKFMAVPQGETFEEWCESAEQLIQLPEVSTLGVSKFLTITTKDPMIRLKAVDFINELRITYNRFVEVHLLGCDTGAIEASIIAEKYSFVRGCDTALAEIFTKADQLMERTSPRPDTTINFLDEILTFDHQKLLSENIERFNQLCRITNVQSSEKAWKE